MKTLKEELDEIKAKVLTLKELYQAEKREKERLLQTVRQLEQELEAQKNTLSTLEEKNKIAKLALSNPLFGEELQQNKLKINNLIREIDKYIKLLSD